MEEQDSIRLQKKMIFMLSVIIFALIVSLMYVKGDFKKVEVATSSEDFEQRLITVQRRIDETIEDDIELIEQVAYTASESIELYDDTEETKPEEVIQEETVPAVSYAVDTSSYVSYQSLAESNPPEEYREVIEATATAYCLCKQCCGKDPWDKWYGYTASGLKIVPGSGMKVIAVDPKVIPLGTKVYVEGLNGAWDYGHAVAADTGSAIKNVKIDLYMDSHQETNNWGVRKVNVYILDN